VPPTGVAHNRPEWEALTQHVRQACPPHDLRDVLVASERTGRYHHVVRDAFRCAHFETRVVHPYTSQRFRQPADADHQTDDTDLAAIQRATVTGFALLEPSLDLTWQTLRLLARHRRELVRKTSILACQIREHLEAAGPGPATLFSDGWDSHVAWPVFRAFASPQARRKMGEADLHAWCRQQRVPTSHVAALRSWADQAAAGEEAAAVYRRLALALLEDRQRKLEEIRALEREWAACLSQTP